jgi:uncharacterized protein (TIGR02145 family)
LPSDAEWFALTDFIIDNHQHVTNSSAGFALRSRRQDGSPLHGGCNTSEHPRWDALPPRNEKGLAALRRWARQLLRGARLGYGKDEFGFTALPGGRCSYGGFYRIGALGYWWSATEASPLRSWCRQMTIGGTVNRWDMGKNYGYSVRCVRD